jgi:BirA family transcriptional regulator, biotin operon repressor / biotin---[acetyl-CoA-carboxylase] ligase
MKYEEWHLNTQRIGQRVLVFDSVDSTNTLAAALAADPGHAGTVVLADEQTAGRGQRGNRWHCPPGAGVLMSVLLFPPPELRRPSILTAWAAVAVCETIRNVTGRRATIKWPNDVLIGGRKVCGILIEQAQGTVAGIGLNVNQSAQSLDEAGLPAAGSLRLFTEDPLDRWAVARQLIYQLDQEYDRLCDGQLGTLEAAWKEGLGLLGKPVRVEGIDQSYLGWLQEINWEHLELESAEGKRLLLRPEMVRHIDAL